MKKIGIGFFTGLLFIAFLGFVGNNINNSAKLFTGNTNFDHIVLGIANYGLDPNPTADVTGQNGEYMTNVVNNLWDFGSAAITTTGTISGGAYVSSDSIGGKLIIKDSLRTKLTSYLIGDVTFGGLISIPVGTGDTNSFTMTQPAADGHSRFYDTVIVAGGTANSIYIVAPEMTANAMPVAGDLLGWHALSGKLVVSRLDTTTKLLKYTWLMIRP